LWVVYFSLAALPLFGIGQVLLPSEEVAARRFGFALLVGYLVAALGLLLTASFLGLRRYLRQRCLRMPATIVFGWIRSGAGLAGVVLAVALLLPRPGADYTWRTLAYQVDRHLQRASAFTSRSNPPGEGQGRRGDHTEAEGRPDTSRPNRDDAERGNHPAGEGESRTGPNAQNARPQARSAAQPQESAAGLYPLLKRLLLAVAALLLVWWLCRQRHLIRQIIRALWQAMVRLLDNLWRFGRGPESPRPVQPAGRPKLHPFAAYRNPFLTGHDRVWFPEQLIAYSFEAVQAWAREQGSEPPQHQTARELCAHLGERFPEIAPELANLACLYAQVAYGRSLPVATDWEPVRQMWRRLDQASAVAG